MSRTADEHTFQQKMLNTLKENQMHDSLKSVMRLKQIEKLNKGKNIPDLSQRQQRAGLTLVEKITASLMYQFLKQKGFTMTLSIFEPEVGENLFLEDTQILELMVKGTESYKKKIMNHLKKKDSTILDYIINSQFKGEVGMIDSCTQTFNDVENMNLEEKLGKLEEFHWKKCSSLEMNNREHLERCRNDIKCEYEKDLAREVKRIREIEMNEFKKSETTKWLERFEKMRQEMDGQLAKRYQDIRDKETMLAREIEERVRIVEKKLHDERQRLQFDKEEGTMKGEILRREFEVEKSRLEKDKEELIRKDRENSRRERECDSKDLGFDERLRVEVDRVRDSDMKGLREERDLVKIKLRTLDSELREVSDLRGMVDKQSKRNNEIGDELEKEKRDQQKEKDRKSGLEKELDELKEDRRMQHESSRRREADSEKLEMRARAYGAENDQLKVMNDEMKQLLEIRKIEMHRIKGHAESHLDHMKKESDAYKEEINNRDKLLIEREIQNIEEKYGNEREFKGGVSGKEKNTLISEFDEKAARLKKERESIIDPGTLLCKGPSFGGKYFLLL